MSDRVEVQFMVVAEMPEDEGQMEDVLAALTTALEDVSPEAANVFADIVNVEPIR